MGDASLCEKHRRRFDLSVIQKATLAEMFVLGGLREERHGNGGGDCWFGKRSWWGSVGFYFFM